PRRRSTTTRSTSRALRRLTYTRASMAGSEHADAAMRVRLERLSSSGVGDASGKRRILDSGIRRLAGDGTFAGRAVTARCEEGSVSAVLRALAECEPGAVLVAHGPGEWAYFGELTGADAVRS